MVREIAISIYLLFFSIVFNLFKIFPLKRKIVFVTTFIENSSYIYEELKRQDPSCRTVFLANARVYSFFSKYDDSLVLKFIPKHPIDFLKSIYHLATAKMVIVDNYYGFLSAITFKKEATCLQIWHASGAIKRFGLEDPSIQNRGKKALKRFKKVYNRFDKIIVGSNEMAEIFKKAFGLDEDRILRSGMPKTDVFYDQQAIEIIEREMYRKFPFLQQKKVILYAPTYRDHELDDFRLQLDLELMRRVFQEEYVVLLRLHPAVKNHMDIKPFEGFVYDFSSYKKLNDVLFVTDVLITDYSSIPFDYSILERPIIFFPYDLAEYEKARGFWGEYSEVVPGPIAFTTEEIIQIIQSEDYHLENLRQFRARWNEYSTGQSSRNTATWIGTVLSLPAN